MFNKSTYLNLPQVTTSAADLINGAEIVLHHQHDVLSGHYNLAAAATAPFLEASRLYDQQDVGGGALASAFSRKPTAKKDRHSKIVTSQGPRDRRVRLSIGIARKFFDLQEMLGFDKPSKTLEWLLTKSKAAIKDLVHTKRTSSARSNCEVVLDGDQTIGNEMSCPLRTDSKRKPVLMSTNNCKGAKDPVHTANSLAKESRAKARARARERTKEKMSIKKLHESRNNMGSDLNPQIPIHSRNSLLEICKPSVFNSQPTLNCPLTNEEAAIATEDLIIQESNVIRRMLMRHPSLFGFHRTLQSANVNENWDISSLTSQSSFCDILDQHKFINRSSNI